MLDIFLEAAIRSCILGLVAWVALSCLRVRNPLTRLTVWTGMLFVAVAMPLLVVARHSLLPPLPMLPAVPEASSIDHLVSATLRGIAPAAAPEPQAVSVIHPAPATDAATAIWPIVVLALYLSVASLLIARLVAGLVRGRSVKRRATPLGAGLYLSKEVTAPVVFGSAILLPADSRDWPAAKRAAVLAHERSHIARGDFYIQLLAGLHRAIFCFSPLGWWLQRELAELAELASDDVAAAASGDRLAYAEILIEVARDARPLAGTVAMARGSEISRRIGRMISGAALSMRLSHRQRALIGAAGTIMLMAGLTATAATSSVARPISQAPTASRFAPVLAALGRLETAPAQLAAQVGALLHMTPSAQPAESVAPTVTQAAAKDDELGKFAGQVGPATYVRGKGWGEQVLITTRPVDGVVTLSELRSMSPRAAGERALAMLDHAPIAQVDFNSELGPVRLVEEWTRVADGCQRLNWLGEFLLPPDAPSERAWLSQVRATAQIARAVGDGCTGARYASLGVGVDRALGFRALAVIEEATAGRRPMRFDCLSSAGRDICASSQSIRAELSRPVHRLIHLVDDKMAVTYNSKGSAGTLMYMTVTFDPAHPERMKVEDLPFPAQTPRIAPPPPTPMFIPLPPQSPPRPDPATTADMAARGNGPEAVKALIPLAEQGDGKAMLLLYAYHYFGRNGVAKDVARGLDFLRQAAESGDTSHYGGEGSTVAGFAMAQLAFGLEHGLNGPADPAEAAIWWRRLAATGDPRGPMILAQRGITP